MKNYLVVSSISSLVVLFIYFYFLNYIKKENGRLWEELNEQYEMIKENDKKTKEKLLCEKILMQK